MAIRLSDWKTPVIEKAIDYSVFNNLKGNRKLNESHIKNLKESMELDPNCIRYNPILVNDQMQIIDGQHRFEAIKRLGFPVFYIKEDDLDLTEAQRLNKSSKQWRPIDYAVSYHELGNKNYSKYLALKDLFDINHDILIRYIALGNPITNEIFRAGGLKVYDYDQTKKLLEMLGDFRELYERAGNRAFALAFLIFAGNPDYDHKRMITRFREYLDHIEDRAIPADYLADLEWIYNAIPRSNN